MSDEDSRHACDNKRKLLSVCSPQQWACPSAPRVCIDVSKICNNIPDCPFGDDEGGLCSKNACESLNAHCSDKCVGTPLGPLCTCPVGQQITNGTTCQDINECLNPATCSQICTNEKRGFTCSCDAGYTLALDRRSCKAKDQSNQMRLYVSNRNRIYWADNQLNNFKTFAASVENVVALAWDSIQDLIYWSDLKDKTIYFSTKDGANKTVVISPDLDLGIFFCRIFFYFFLVYQPRHRCD